MEKQGRHRLNQMIEVRITNHGTSQCHAPPDMRHQGVHDISSVTVLPKMRNLNVIMKRHQADPGCQTIFKLSGLCISYVKNVKGTERLRAAGGWTARRRRKRHNQTHICNA